MRVWRWLVAILLALGLGSAVLLSEQPTGGISGQLSFPSGYSAVPVQAIARGSVVRGVMTDRSGHFQLNNLPTGDYQLEISAPGFRRVETTVSDVTEGRIQDLAAITLELLEPSLNLYGTSQVFTPDETPQLNLSASGLDAVEVAVYPFQLQDFLGTSTLAELADPYGNGFKGLSSTAPLKTWRQRITKSTTDDWSTQTLSLPSLEPGSYGIKVTGQGITGKTATATAWVMVTDLGLIQKQSQDQLLVEAVDLRTGQPLPQISLQVFSADSHQRLKTLTTDDQGLSRWQIPPAQPGTARQLILYARSPGGKEALSGMNYYNYGGENEFYTYTDRPLYRPGQTVYFRSVIRRPNPKGAPVPLPVGSFIQVTVNDPNGDPVYEAALETGRFGTVHGSFDLPEQADLGTYGLQLALGDNTDYTSIQVEEYRKPEFDITLTPDQPWIQQGGSVQVSAEAEYLFGGPVANAKVHYLVYRSSDWGFRYEVLPRSPEEAYFGNDIDEERYPDYGGYGDVVMEGDTTTDVGGLAKISLTQVLSQFDWQRDSYFGESPVQQLRIEVQITDISRRSVTRDVRVRVTQNPVALFVQSDRYVATPGESVTYTLQSYTYDKKPASVQGSLSLEEWEWSEDSYKKVRTVLSQSFSTADGKGTATLTLPGDLPTGDYRLQATTSSGSQDLDFLWVTNPDSPWLRWSQDRGEGVRVIPDKTVYEVGDTARIVVTSPVADAYALLTVEGSTLYQSEIRRFQGNVLTLELPITAAFQPNVYYAVTLIGPKRQIYEGQSIIRVSPLNRFLQVDLETDRSVYQPGETATVRIRTLDSQGRPVSAEVSLGVVDAAIYILRPDTTPDIRRYFYHKRYNQVSTAYSFPQQYPGGLNKLANQVRQDFKDTAAWFPDIVTDAQGTATVQVPLPDNLTRWQLTARATTVDTQVGSTLGSVQVTKDLLVRLATPRFFRTGDQLQLTAVIQNQSSQEQAVAVRLEVPSLLRPSGELTRQITLPPQTAQRVQWLTQIVSAGSATVRVSAEASQLWDAMQLDIPVQPYGTTFRDDQRGSLTASGDESRQIPVNLPQSVVPGSLEATVTLAANPAADLLGALDYLAQFPYGCTEQTLSRFLPALAVAQASTSLDLPLQEQTAKKLPKIVQDGLKRLEKLQHGDGGWGWWQFDTSNPYLTSYVLMGYQRAAAAGYPVSPEQTEKGLVFLKQQMANNQEVSPDTQMIGQYVLGLYQQANLKAVQQTDPTTLSTLGLTYRSLALAQLGQTSLALTDLNQVLERVGLDWNWFQVALNPWTGRRPFWERNTFEGSEVAGPLLQAATLLNHPRAAAIADWILNARQGDRWLTTKANADAILGLTRYYAVQSARNPALYTVSLTHQGSGSRVGQWTPSGEEQVFSVNLLPEDLQPGNQSLILDKAGSGPLYYSLKVQGFAQAAPGEQIGGQSQGFKVTRQYFTLTAQPQAGGKIHYQEQPLRGSVPSGTLLMAKVTVEAAQDSNYVMVEDPLPSGAEVTSQDPRLLTGEETEDGYWWDWFWVEQDVRDDRITFFSTELSKGSHEFVYLFRPEIPGEFSVPPTQVEEMYAPTRVFGRSQSQSFQVTE